MDGSKLKNTYHLGAKRKREASPQRKESDFKGNTRETTTTSTIANFGLTGNGKKGDRYVSKDVASYQNAIRPYADKPIPTGPRSQRERQFRSSQQSVESRIYAGYKRALGLLEANNTPKGMKLILKSGEYTEKPKNSHSSTSSSRGNQKTFSSVRGLESQEEYMKRSIARQKQGYKDPKSTRKAENLQREFAKKERYSPIESISTADDERNRELLLNRIPSSSKADELEQSPFEEYYRSKQTFDNGSPVILPRPDPVGPIADDEVASKIRIHANQAPEVMVNEKNLGVLIDHAFLPAPILQATSLLHGALDASSALPLPFSQVPFSQFTNDLITTHEIKSSDQPLLARKDSSTSTSAMSISSGSTPVHSPARNSPHTSLHTVSPSRSSASGSTRGKSSTCIFCKEPAAPPLKQLVRCIECKHNYHTHCHAPLITVKNGKLDVDANSWVCSRCTKIQKVPSTTTTKKIVTTLTPNCHFGNSVTPNHKRRKLDSEANNENLPSWDNQVTCSLLSDRFSIGLNPVIHANIGHLSGKLPDDIYNNGRPKDGLLSKSLFEDFQHIEGSSLETQCVPIIAPVSAIQDFQAIYSQIGENEQHIPEVNSNLPTELSNGQPTGTNSNCGSKDNDDDIYDAPMDLDSPAGSPQQALLPDNSCSIQLTQNPTASGESDSNMGTVENVDYPMLDKESPVFGKETESDTTSPPYSPRLDSEPLASPVNEISLSLQPTTTEKSKQIFSNSVPHEIPVQPIIQNSPLLPLIIASTSIAPADPLRGFLGPTTTFPCASCGVQWLMFTTVARPDGKNYCANCLYMQQKSPKQAGKPLKSREPVTERRIPPPVSKDPRSPPSSIQSKLRLERDGLNNSFSKVARSPATYRSPSRHPPEPEPIKQPSYKHPPPKESPIQEPVEKIKTAQQMMEEKYQTCPEIFPTNARPPPSKDVPKLSEEKPAATQIKDKSDSKDIPKRRLTVSEYALRQKEKEKEKEKEKALAKKDGDESPQETEDVCISEVCEATVSPSIPGVDAGKPVETLVATTAPVAQPDNTETQMSEELRQKMSLEIEQWKKKFEEQQKFFANYVKHNAKIMDKLTLVKQQRAALEKKTVTLEAELSTHRTKEEKLREENELLRQERHQQEEDLQARLRVEREAAEARAKAMDKISRDVVDNSSQEEECQAFLMRNVYKNLTFDIIDPLKDIAGVLTNVPDKPFAVPSTRYSIARKSEPFTFNCTNLRSLHLHREVDRGLDIINVQRDTKSKRSATNSSSSSSSASSSSSTTMGEAGDGTIMSFEEFARVPPNMVPVLKDGVLAFRTGQLNLRTRRLDRSVHCYKVGRDVPGELRGLR